jgi:predicted nucleotidyltransferase
MIKNKLTLDYVLPRLKELFEKFENVETAILFGSIAKK